MGVLHCNIKYMGKLPVGLINFDQFMLEYLDIFPVERQRQQLIKYDLIIFVKMVADEFPFRLETTLNSTIIRGCQIV